MNKICRKCKIIKSIDEFNKDKYQFDGYMRICRECQAQNGKIYRKKNSIIINRRNKIRVRMRRYGVTIKQYNELFELQNGKCAICGIDNNKLIKQKLGIDHDHNTNKIRGLLCSNCNLALGCMHDDIKLLYNAINYLKNNS